MNTLAVWLVCEFTRCTVGACTLWFMWSWCDNCYKQDEQDINNTIYNDISDYIKNVIMEF